MQALGRESFSQHITAGETEGLSHLLEEDCCGAGSHSMTTLSEKSQEDGSPFKKRGNTDKHLRLNIENVVIVDDNDLEFFSPSKRSVKSEDDSPCKRRAGSPSKKKIIASKFQMNEMEKSEWGARLIEESMKVDDQIRSQIQKIQEIRKQTQDAINTSASVVNAY